MFFVSNFSCLQGNGRHCRNKYRAIVEGTHELMALLSHDNELDRRALLGGIRY